MIIVTIVLAAALVVSLSIFASALRSQQRAHARREDLLLNQLLNAVGKPWQPAPADEREPVTPREIPPRRYTATPEQFPDQYPE